MNQPNQKKTLNFFIQKSTCGQNETSFLIHAGEETAEFWSEAKDLVADGLTESHFSYHQTERLVAEALDLVIAIEGILVHAGFTDEEAVIRDLSELTRPRTLSRWVHAYKTLSVLSHNGVKGANPLFREVLRSFNDKLKRKGVATLDWHLGFDAILKGLDQRAELINAAIHGLPSNAWFEHQAELSKFEDLIVSIRQYWVTRKWWDNVLRGCSDSELIRETGEVILELRVGLRRKPRTD